MKKKLLYIAGVIVLITLGYGAYYVYSETAGCKDIPEWVKSEYSDDDSDHSRCYYWKKAGRPINDPYKQRYTDDTNGWKTYENEEYGFEFKYPSDESRFNVEKDSVNTVISIGNAYYPAFLVVVEKTNATDALEYALGALDDIDVEAYELGPTVTIGGKEWVSTIPNKLYKPTEHGGEVILDWNSFYMIENGYLYNISYRGFYKEGRGILDSFRFNPIPRVTEWDIYTNHEYGFEFEYPDAYENGFVNNMEMISESMETSKNAYDLLKNYIDAFLARTKYDSYPSISVAILPLKGYLFDNQRGGKRTFDLENNRCVFTESYMGEVYSTTTESKLISGAHACYIVTGEAGEVGRGYAIPNKEKGIVIEVMTYYAYPDRFEYDRFYSTFKFTN